jgi:hypothetical protein
MIIYENYAGNKQKSYKLMKTQMFATLDEANRDIGNIRGLNLTVQVTKSATAAGATNDRE